MNPFEFAGLVELARALRREIPPYCGTCGCVNLRWAGCDDSWHTGRTAVRSASVGVQTKTGRVGATTPPQPSTQKPGMEAPMSCLEGTTHVNPEPASDGA